MVGAEGDDFGTKLSQGSAYVFAKPSGGWADMTETAKLTASDGSAHDRFGYAVSISGDTVVVGAPRDDIGTNEEQGSAYAFERPPEGWVDMTETGKLIDQIGAKGNLLGSSVSISGDTVVVGATSAWVKGRACIFVRPAGGWQNPTYWKATLYSVDISEDHPGFGFSVSISGDTAVVGAYRDTIGGNTTQGSAYVFKKPHGGWPVFFYYAAKLTARDGAAGDFFGYSVSISGDTVLVGAYGDDDKGSKSGSAYVFKMTGGLAPIYMLLLGDDG